LAIIQFNRQREKSTIQIYNEVQVRKSILAKEAKQRQVDAVGSKYIDSLKVNPNFEEPKDDLSRCSSFSSPKLAASLPEDIGDIEKEVGIETRHEGPELFNYVASALSLSRSHSIYIFLDNLIFLLSCSNFPSKNSPFNEPLFNIPYFIISEAKALVMSETCYRIMSLAEIFQSLEFQTLTSSFLLSFLESLVPLLDLCLHSLTIYLSYISKHFVEGHRPPERSLWTRDLVRWSLKAGMSPKVGNKTPRKTIESWMLKTGIPEIEIFPPGT
jgi:hypothetical protein